MDDAAFNHLLCESMRKIYKEKEADKGLTEQELLVYKQRAEAYCAVYGEQLIPQ